MKLMVNLVYACLESKQAEVGRDLLRPESEMLLFDTAK